MWYKQTNRWRATIKVNNKDVYLGYYLDIADAVSVRKQAEIEYGYHPNHGTRV
jgi:hypothetical protein